MQGCMIHDTTQCNARLHDACKLHDTCNHGDMQVALALALHNNACEVRARVNRVNGQSAGVEPRKRRSGHTQGGCKAQHDMKASKAGHKRCQDRAQLMRGVVVCMSRWKYANAAHHVFKKAHGTQRCDLQLLCSKGKGIAGHSVSSHCVHLELKARARRSQGTA
eukprot:1157364-Pelagomonas_calceolata.AAC.8